MPCGRLDAIVALALVVDAALIKDMTDLSQYVSVRITCRENHAGFAVLGRQEHLLLHARDDAVGFWRYVNRHIWTRRFIDGALFGQLLQCLLVNHLAFSFGFQYTK